MWVLKGIPLFSEMHFKIRKLSNPKDFQTSFKYDGNKTEKVFSPIKMERNIAQFWFSKSIFYVKNQPKLSDFFFIEEYKNRRITFIIDIF